MTGEGEVLYRTVPWDLPSVPRLQSTGKTPAGPLFSIECRPQESVCQLHLPHCGVTPGDDLLVAHITEETVEFLEPMKVTKTHVVVNVTHLSLFGLIWDYFTGPKPTSGQVLLFLRPPSDRLEMKVLLLPSNVDIDAVILRHKKDKYIETTSNCTLSLDQVYSLQCTPHEVQPAKGEPYRLEYGPNYHANFEVFMDLSTEHVSLEVQGPKKNEVWRRQNVKLKGGPSEPTRMKSSLSLPDNQDFFTKNRGDLVSKVKNVEPIIDDLQGGGFHAEMAANVHAENTPQARMRRVLDTVTSTGAAEALFNALVKHEELLMKDLLE